jgi:hypothetical protein
MDIYHFDMEKASDTERREFLLAFRAQDVLEVIQKAISQGLYQKVAHVNTQDLEKAFHLTNQIDSNWTENKEVTALTQHNRSSSVGDIFVLNNEAHFIQSIGFQKLPDELAQALVSEPRPKLKM